MAPDVSVVIATYNWSSVLRYAIETALAQTLKDIEVLVIAVTARTDDSPELVASFHDPRLIWHNLPSNTGSQSTPNNTGIAMARGRYIAYLSHDDLWMPHHLERLAPRRSSAIKPIWPTESESWSAPKGQGSER